VQDVIRDANGEINNMWASCEARQGRVAALEEIGDAAVLITSPKMSLVNGHNLVVDG